MVKTHNSFGTCIKYSWLFNLGILRKIAAFTSVLALFSTLAIATAPAASASPNNVNEMLASLTISNEVNASTYKRTSFKHWIDANKNGCDTRAEVLIAESETIVTKKSKCTIVSGRWMSLYDNKVVTLASKLDIDHLVPLAEAWRSGASKWTAAQRQAFANDLDVSYGLVAVTAGSNRSKSDNDPATWLPSNAAIVCNYIGSWIAMKYRWSLAADPQEKSVLESKLTTCGSQSNVAVPEVKISPASTSGQPTAVKPTADASAASRVANIKVQAQTAVDKGGTLQVEIQATDKYAKPVAGVLITYDDSTGLISGQGPVTDSNGISTFTISLNPAVNYVSAIIFRGGNHTGSHVIWIKEKVSEPTPTPTNPLASPEPTATPTVSDLDPRYSTCALAKAYGHGPYRRSLDPEYYWYVDRDKDGIVCE